MNSREKGKRGERAWRDELRAHGFAARRGQQFCGGQDSPDVVCDQLRWVHFEVKAVERLNIEEAMEQARADARKSGNRESGKAESPSGRAPENGMANGTSQMAKVPIVAHRRKFCGWLVTMGAESFFEFLRGSLPPEGTGVPATCGVAKGAEQEMEFRI
jgi:hypothetical protein